jgi:hypothetical protein
MEPGKYISVTLRSNYVRNNRCAEPGWRLDGRGVGVRIPVGAKIFFSPRRPDRFWDPPSLLSNGYQGLSPGVKRQGRETDQSPPTSARSRISGSIHPLPHTPSWRSV